MKTNIDAAARYAAPTPDRATEATDLSEPKMDAAIEAYDKAWNPANRGRENKEHALRAAFAAIGGPDLGARDAALLTEDQKARLVLDAMDATDEQSEAAPVEMSPREHAALLYDLLAAGIQGRAIKSQPAAAVVAPVEAVTDDFQIDLGHGAYLRFETKTTGAPGWLMYNEHGLVRLLNECEILLVNAALAKSKGRAHG